MAIAYLLIVGLKQNRSILNKNKKTGNRKNETGLFLKKC